MVAGRINAARWSWRREGIKLSFQGSANCGAEGGRALEAQMGQKLTLFGFHHKRAFQAFKRGLRIVIAERGGLLVVVFGGVLVLRSAPSGFGKIAPPITHPARTLR